MYRAEPLRSRREGKDGCFSSANSGSQRENIWQGLVSRSGGGGGTPRGGRRAWYRAEPLPCHAIAKGEGGRSRREDKGGSFLCRERTHFILTPREIHFEGMRSHCGTRGSRGGGILTQRARGGRGAGVGFFSSSAALWVCVSVVSAWMTDRTRSGSVNSGKLTLRLSDGFGEVAGALAHFGVSLGESFFAPGWMFR